MIFKKVPLENEKLDAAIQIFKMEANKSSSDALAECVLDSIYWLPIKISPAPKKTPNGDYIVTPKNNISFITAHKEENGTELSYFIAFTNPEAYKAWADGKRYDIGAVDCSELAVMMFRPGAIADGVVINPGTDTIVLPKEVIKQTILKRENAAKNEQ